MEKKKEETGITKIESTEVTVIPSKEELQAGMRKTLKELDEKLEKLSVPVDKPWKISSFVFRGDGFDINIQPSVCPDVHLMVKALIMVRRSLKDFNDIKKELNLSTDAFCSIAGYRAEDVIEELERSIKIRTNTKTIADIKAAKVKLEAFLSEDDRLIKTLSEVEGLLK